MALRFGRVSSVDASRHTAQVTFEDTDEEMVSYDLHVLADKDGDFHLPATDVQVACFLADDSSGVGVVLGVAYNDLSGPPSSAKAARIVGNADGKISVTSKSGTKVEINGADHPLPKWDTFESDLSTLLNDIATALASGTSGSPVLQQLVGLATIQASVAAFRVKLAAANFDSTKGANG